MFNRCWFHPRFVGVRSTRSLRSLTIWLLLLVWYFLLVCSVFVRFFCAPLLFFWAEIRRWVWSTRGHGLRVRFTIRASSLFPVDKDVPSARQPDREKRRHRWLTKPKWPVSVAFSWKLISIGSWKGTGGWRTIFTYNIIASFLFSFAFCEGSFLAFICVSSRNRRKRVWLLRVSFFFFFHIARSDEEWWIIFLVGRTKELGECGGCCFCLLLLLASTPSERVEMISTLNHKKTGQRKKKRKRFSIDIVAHTSQKKKTSWSTISVAKSENIYRGIYQLLNQQETKTSHCYTRAMNLGQLLQLLFFLLLLLLFLLLFKSYKFFASLKPVVPRALSQSFFIFIIFFLVQLF